MTSALHHAGARDCKITPSQQESIPKPAGWMNYRYPFIYGQPDTRQFPLTTWRSAANWLARRRARSGLGRRSHRPVTSRC